MAFGQPSYSKCDTFQGDDGTRFEECGCGCPNNPQTVMVEHWRVLHALQADPPQTPDQVAQTMTDGPNKAARVSAVIATGKKLASKGGLAALGVGQFGHLPSEWKK